MFTGQVRAASRESKLSSGNEVTPGNASSFVTKCDSFFLQGAHKFVEPSLSLAKQFSVDTEYIDSEIHDGPCSDLGFPSYGLVEPCYTRLTIWFRDGQLYNESDNAVYSNGHALPGWGHCDDAADRLFDSTHTQLRR
eukprot:TRINITY_DN10294_c0_g2_i1.p1 TRINITY_DN10294_c0_g2~~TRINITY_DN10294_c0_g2_i1.p1  ORF type:complete len:137 (+),score=18.34 TRINITY_DN10294_c0_g2_i1:174-584(+)